MDEVISLSVDTAKRLFEERFPLNGLSAPAAEWRPTQWMYVSELGLPLALANTEVGGLGLDPFEAVPLLKLLGRYAIRLPLAETMLANLVLGRAGLRLAHGIATLSSDVVDIVALDKGYRVTGQLGRVAWARHAESVVVATNERIALVPLTDVALTPGRNLADEPRDNLVLDVVIDGANVADLPASLDLRAVGAAMRNVQIAGVIERLLELSIAHATERVQFGRPLSKFQSIQHDIARLAAQTAAASTAADMSATFLAGRGSMLSLAAAKTRVAEAAGMAAAISHQVHGAIGFTEEHGLHRFTRSVLAWREEFGGQAHWSRVVADRVLDHGSAELWPIVTEG